MTDDELKTTIAIMYAQYQVDLKDALLINDRIIDWLKVGEQLRADLIKNITDTNKLFDEMNATLRDFVSEHSIDPADWWRQGPPDDPDA